MNDSTYMDSLIQTRLRLLDIDMTDLEKFLRNHDEAVRYLDRIEALYARFGKVVEGMKHD